MNPRTEQLREEWNEGRSALACFDLDKWQKGTATSLQTKQCITLPLLFFVLCARSEVLCVTVLGGPTLVPKESLLPNEEAQA